MTSAINQQQTHNSLNTTTTSSSSLQATTGINVQKIKTHIYYDETTPLFDTINDDPSLSLYNNNTDVEHCHDSEHKTKYFHHVATKSAGTRLVIVSVICFLFMCGEFVGGYIAGSLAIMTDAAHLLSDLAGFLISLFALFIGSKPATMKMSYGWSRAEVVGALLSVFLIWILTGVLVFMALKRIISSDYEINALIMLITASVGLIINLIMAFTLHDSQSHGHNHDSKNESFGHQDELQFDVGYQETSGRHRRQPENINVRAAFIHVLGDIFQSVGVVIAAIIIYYKPEYKIADPICTFVFSILVLFTTIAILRDAIMVLMEGSPKHLNFVTVKQALKEVPGVMEVHNLRIWSLTASKPAVSVHLAYDPTSDGICNHSICDPQELLKNAQNTLRKRFNIFDITIQMESYVSQMADCDECKGPNK